MPSVKEALDEVTFTFILSPFPGDYANISVPVTSEAPHRSIHSFNGPNVSIICANTF